MRQEAVKPRVELRPAVSLDLDCQQGRAEREPQRARPKSEETAAWISVDRLLWELRGAPMRDASSVTFRQTDGAKRARPRCVELAGASTRGDARLGRSFVSAFAAADRPGASVTSVTVGSVNNMRRMTAAVAKRTSGPLGPFRRRSPGWETADKDEPTTQGRAAASCLVTALVEICLWQGRGSRRRRQRRE